MSEKIQAMGDADVVARLQKRGLPHWEFEKRMDSPQN
jgi:hypothetical protein